MSYRLIFEGDSVILKQLDKVGNILQTLQYVDDTANELLRKGIVYCQEIMISDLTFNY